MVDAESGLFVLPSKMCGTGMLAAFGTVFRWIVSVAKASLRGGKYMIRTLG